MFPDILEDMKEECQKYGSVVSLLIPKENPGKGQVRVVFCSSMCWLSVYTPTKPIRNINRDFMFSLFCFHQVFVEYANSSDSKEAQRLLTGRTFDGKFVVATFYPLSAYKRGYLYQTVQ